MQTKLFFSIVFSFLLVNGCSQTPNTGSKLNLNFENIQDGKPQNWLIYPQKNYTVSFDSVNVKSGKYSIVLEFTGDTISSQAIRFLLPDNYDGKRITLSGYIKTENVSDGWAGLWMRIDPQIAFDNMQQRGITGTTDWKKYEITLTMNPTKTKQILLGGLLMGKGKMWLDDLQITIDGKDIKDAKTIEKKIFPAEKDKAFDTGSNITFPTLNKQEINNLDLLGRIWGFLKYHHPEVGKGNYNWDYELFRMLPEYLTITNNAKRDEYLLLWIEKLGEIHDFNINMEKIPVDAFLKPDFSWIDKSDMNQKLKEELKVIYRNRNYGEQYYIQMAANVGNPVFTNENSYPNMTHPDAGFRLLALYRYWNMINYFYPNKNLTDKNWNTVLKEYIPKFVLAESELSYEMIALKLIGELGDSHAQLLEGRQKIDSLRGNWLAPFQVRFVENKLVVTKYYEPDLQATTGLKVGDIITHIDGKSVGAIVDSVKAYYSASNEAARMRDIANYILCSNSKTVHISYNSHKQLKQTELTLIDRNTVVSYMYKKTNTQSYKLLNDTIGYITLQSIKQEDIDNIKKDFKNTQGIIIDIRNYPSYFVPFLLGSYFVSSTTPFVKFLLGNPDNPGEFTFTSPIAIPKSEETYRGKLVVLVNEDTQSQAEYTAMAFRAGANTTIIGSQTAGADGNVSEIFLPGGLKTWISGIGVFYPDGRQTQRIGIVPDIVVKPTIKGIREGRDEVLEKAIKIINSDK